MSVLGIDISKSWPLEGPPFFDVNLIKIGKTGKVSSSVSPLQHRFDNTVAGFKQLGQWLKDCRVKQVHACLEATGRYGDALALWLHTQKHVVSVINPSIIHAYAQVQLRRNKTDTVDADLIARYCLSERPEAWTPPARETLDLQAQVAVRGAILKRLDDLKAMRQQELNRLESIVPCQQVAEYIQQHVSFLDNQIHELDVATKKYTKATPAFAAQLKLLVTIPGIGILTAMRLIAFDLLKFENAGAAVAMAGLNPSQHTSGTSVERKAHLSKQGHADIRKALYMPALTALTHNPCVRELATRMAAKSKPPMVIVGAAMHKLLRLAYGVLKSNTPFDPNYAIQP